MKIIMLENCFLFSKNRDLFTHDEEKYIKNVFVDEEGLTVINKDIIDKLDYGHFNPNDVSIIDGIKISLGNMTMIFDNENY